jgi:hypothetical protein
MNLDAVGVGAFLAEYPNMSLSVVTDGSTDLVLRGTFNFAAKFKDEPEIEDSYSLEIRIPDNFPSELPSVKELGSKIPRDGKHHVNPDETLCLGSPLRLKMLVRAKPTLSGFASSCIVPYLYWITTKKFAVGELAHGDVGIIADYMALFDLSDPKQIIPTLKLLGMKKRVANKKPCPCGCGVRLGRCSKRFILNRYRGLAPRRWFRDPRKPFGEKSK